MSILALMFAAAVSTASSGEQMLQHTLALERSDCAAWGPASRREEERVETRWVDGRLEVEAWAFESGDTKLTEQNSAASLRGNRIRLSFTSVELPSPPPEVPDLGCSFPVRVHFTVIDLPQREYKVEMRLNNAPFRRGRADG